MTDPASPKPPKLLDRMREALRVRHCSYRNEQAYLDWARRSMLFHGKRHPAGMGAAEVGVFLTHLATERQASASTQNQAKAALLFPYREVLAECRSAMVRRGRPGQGEQAAVGFCHGHFTDFPLVRPLQSESGEKALPISLRPILSTHHPRKAPAYRSRQFAADGPADRERGT